jgi:large subunit ribosomal protein L10
MRKEEKNKVIESLTKDINAFNHLYLTDISGLNADATSNLRRKCFEKEIKMVVAKNTLLKLALDKAEGDYQELYEILNGNTSILLSATGNLPAKLIKEFRKGKMDRPILKGAYVEQSVYLGDDQLDALSNIKSKEELIGDIVMLLQSPAKNVISSLQSGGNTLTGVIKTLSEREQ